MTPLGVLRSFLCSRYGFAMFFQRSWLLSNLVVAAKSSAKVTSLVSFTGFCFSGDILFWSLLKHLLGICLKIFLSKTKFTVGG